MATAERRRVLTGTLDRAGRAPLTETAERVATPTFLAVLYTRPEQAC